MMRHTMTAAAAMAALAGSVSAQFSARSVDAHSIASPIGVSGALHDIRAGAPSPQTIDAQPAAAYSTYIALDLGPSTGGEPSNPDDGFWCNPSGMSTIGSPFGTPGEVKAVWFANPGGPRDVTIAAPQPWFGGRYGLFIGRFVFSATGAVQAGGSLSLGPSGVVVDIADTGTSGVGSPATDSLLLRFTAFDAPVQSGLDAGDLQSYSAASPYLLTLRTFRTSVGATNFLVNDLYVVQVPAPGAAIGLLGAGLLGRRRRRRGCRGC